MSAPDGPEIGGRELGWDALARSARDRHQSAGEDSVLLRELLAFELGGTPYALPVERVREIVRMRSITPVPRVPAAVRGVISLRGEIIQVLDLRLRLGLEPTEATRRSRIIVLHGEDERVAGVMVDAVSEVLRLPEEAIRPVAQGESDSVAALCKSNDEFVSLVDLDRVLDLDADD